MPITIQILLVIIGLTVVVVSTLYFLRRRREAHEIGPVRESRGLRKTKPYFRREVIERKVRSLFPNLSPNKILGLLDSIAPPPDGVERLQLAILKLSDGDMDELRRLVDRCLTEDGLYRGADRGLIGAAEWPEAQSMGYEYVRLLPEEQEPIFRRDLRQYLRWVKR